MLPMRSRGTLPYFLCISFLHLVVSQEGYFLLPFARLWSDALGWGPPLPSRSDRSGSGLELYGFMWVSMNVYGSTWICMESYWITLNLYRIAIYIN